ncbi:hypothetical protein [Hyphococcus luteus]|uniref:Uncharacterized protein n=1 Tax=Hyphococcus luteus TaxID=2058213 RepID=A0A2S7JYT7_9PROT|nr:hypothetical protein [Marinicaulis flavus]PQA85402.1 hypothetical protein CW354_20865 [Marinicaulis flavus]
MEAGRIILAGISFSVAGLGAAGDVVFTRPGPCAAQETYLLAANSAALIRVEAPEDGAANEGVIYYRKPDDRRGWASRRLLQRFDLSLEEAGVTIINSGEFCRGTQ